MWFIAVEVEQETSAPPPKKILDPPLVLDIIDEFVIVACKVAYNHEAFHFEWQQSEPR